MSHIIISIEGNIGSGKSTILKIIKQNFPQLTILDQPLSCWQHIGTNRSTNLLKLYYQNPQRWGFTFQIYAFMTRLTKWTQFSKISSSTIKISQRSLLSDRYIFASIMRDADLLSTLEHQIYIQCYNGLKNINQITQVSGVIYIQCDPKICSDRIKKRARQGQDSIPLDYLQRIHNKHQQWLNPSSKSNIQQTQSTNSQNSQQLSQQHKDSIQSQQNNYSTSITQQKVLIIDNTDYINKNKIINDIKTWLKTFQSYN